MQNYLTEAEAKKRLGITDWRYLSKDKFFQFISCLDQMEPEVAKKVIEQFPNFSRMATEALKDYKSSVDAAIKANADLNAQFLDLCNHAIDVVKGLGSGDNVTWEQKKYCMDTIKAFVEAAANMTSESRQSNHGHINALTVVTLSLIGMGVVVLGGHFYITHKGKRS